MALDIEISFVAGIAIDHDVCYRLQGTTTFTCVTVSANLGSNTVTIQVPSNFCDTAIYEGYVIASCSNTTDTDGDGFPDAVEGVSQFAITIAEQASDCDPYIIACTGVPVVDINIIDGGTGYATNEELVANGTDTIGFITAPGGIITGFTPALPFNYSTPPTLTVNTVSGVDADLEAILGQCIFEATGCDGQTDVFGNTAAGPLDTYLPVNTDIEICSDVEPTIDPITSTGSFTVTPSVGENCRCTTCVKMTVTNGTGGNVTLSFTTCGLDDAAVIFQQLIIPTGTLNLVVGACVIPESISWDTDDVSFTVVEGPCEEVS